MLRKGRFDEIFFVDLPEADARMEILGLHLSRRRRDAAAYDLEALAAISEGFSGSELEQAVVSALYTAFSRDAPLSQEHLTSEIAATRPLSETMRERIDALREWARERTRSAH